MPIPGFQDVMLPLLKFLADEKEHKKQEAVEHIADFFKLTPEERKERLKSGRQIRIGNRVGWARTYMKKAGLIEYPSRGVMKITPRGLEVLNENPDRIDIKFLERFPEFMDFKYARKDDDSSEEQIEDTETDQTPTEMIENAHKKLNRGLAQELLGMIKDSSPDFFETLVVDLLLKMGYGNFREGAGEVTSRTGDEGVDGIIAEDKLGLDLIYIQAKRWENPVSRPEIQKFSGALDLKRANKGVFITTSDFTRDAKECVEKMGKKIVLVNGQQLAQLMIDHNVGVAVKQTFEIKDIDSDYFSED